MMILIMMRQEEKNRINWQKWWVKCGFLCEIAQDFKSALLKIDSHSYDVILLFLHGYFNVHHFFIFHISGSTKKAAV